MMVCGRLRVRLRLVNSHGDIIVRKMEVTTVEESAILCWQAIISITTDTTIFSLYHN